MPDKQHTIGLCNKRHLRIQTFTKALVLLLILWGKNLIRNHEKNNHFVGICILCIAGTGPAEDNKIISGRFKVCRDNP